MKVVFGFLAMISCTVVANLLLKLGAVAPIEHRIFQVVDWKTVAGFTSFALAGMVYAWLLAFLPLNVAQSFAAAQFIAVILASALILSESISITRWFGITLIFAGIVVVGLGRSS
jgi:undecaprenyl phosphate-alpha-L-ara4N flippase subunit ArnE